MNIKIGVGVPSRGTIKSETARSLMEMMKLPYDFHPIFVYSAYISANREKIVEMALAAQCSHILFIDHDIKFPISTIEIMLEQNKDIIGAMHNYRFLPLRPMVKFFDKNNNVVDKVDKIPTETFKVAGIGGGCLLIKASVFEIVKPPRFQMLYGCDGTIIRTEDIGFCEKAREYGFDIWCDPNLDVKHIGDYEF